MNTDYKMMGKAQEAWNKHCAEWDLWIERLRAGKAGRIRREKTVLIKKAGKKEPHTTPDS